MPDNLIRIDEGVTHKERLDNPSTTIILGTRQPRHVDDPTEPNFTIHAAKARVNEILVPPRGSPQEDPEEDRAIVPYSDEGWTKQLSSLDQDGGLITEEEIRAAQARRGDFRRTRKKLFRTPSATPTTSLSPIFQKAGTLYLSSATDDTSCTILPELCVAA